MEDKIGKDRMKPFAEKLDEEEIYIANCAHPDAQKVKQRERSKELRTHSGTVIAFIFRRMHELINKQQELGSQNSRGLRS